MVKLVTLLVALTALTSAINAEKPPEQMTMDELEAEIKSLEQTVESLANQLMQQQTFVEERIRSEAMSGIHTLRHRFEGTKPYFGDSHVSVGALGIYDPVNWKDHLSFDRFTAVMNGVEFKAQNGGFRFSSPSHKSHSYNAREDIPFPDVPPQVKNKHTVTEQITEMQQWFKAFHEQNYTVRDYRKYFKPNLCYLEGAYELPTTTMNLPGEDPKHWNDAKGWFGYAQKFRFSAYAGTDSNKMNYGNLPITMYNISSGIPQFARWNYRILCHALKQDVPTHYFELQDDLANRMARNYHWDKEESYRAARYKLNEFGTDRFMYYSFLDDLMAEIPGKNNYGANLTDDSFGLLNYAIKDPSKMDVLNTANYHRWFKLGVKGAMGLTINHRGYHDENMWVAQTTQPNVMPMSMRHCVTGDCSWSTKRVSYALPLEIVYTTPLTKWNPYNLHFQTDNKAQLGNGRNGGRDASHAFNGTSVRQYHVTPAEFYKATRKVGVLNPKGEVKLTTPSGFRFTTPEIPDVGQVRLRYPIFPVHSEGSTQGQELMALKQMVMKMGRYQYLYEEKPTGQALSPEEDKTFIVRPSYKTPPGLHGHSFTMTSDEYKKLMNGTEIDVTTSYNVGHQHTLRVRYNSAIKTYVYTSCDGHARYQPCWDSHPRTMTLSRA